jgi:PAS domain S-box-containing protein
MLLKTSHIYSPQELESLSKAELIALVQSLQSPAKNSSEQITEREANLEALVEQADDFVCAIDTEGRVLIINRSYYNHVKNHYNVDLKVGDKAFGYLKPDQQLYWNNLINRVLQGEVIKQEVRSSRNAQNYWQFTFSPLYNLSGEMMGVSYFARDISRLKLSEKSLQRKTEELAKIQANFKALVNNTDDFICSLDQDLRVLIINVAYQNYIFSRYKIVIKEGDKIFEIFTESTASFWIHQCKKALKGKKINRVMPSITDSSIFWQISLNPVYDSAENIIGVSFFIKNISELIKSSQELQQLSQELAEKEANLSALIENTKDLICSVDKDYRLITANSAYLAYIKKRYNHDLEKGSYMFEQSGKGVEEYWLPIYDRALAGESFKMERRYSLNNEDIWFEHYFNPIREKDGKISGIAFFIKNITADKIKGMLMEKNYRQLQKINAELDRFVYSVSHDLRAPLASILGLIEISKLEINVETRNHYLDLMQKSVKKLDGFIRDIIDFSRNARLEINPENIIFTDLIQEVLDELKYLPEIQYLVIQQDISQALDFQSDSKRLKVILQNLMGNAIRYSDKFKEEPYIKIKVSVFAQEAQISIEDNGQGIGEAHLGKIFEMFYRASAHTSGSGLGLYIVKETLDKLKGSIEVKSILGKGTTFSLKIPKYITN